MGNYLYYVLSAYLLGVGTVLGLTFWIRIQTKRTFNFLSMQKNESNATQ